MLVVAAFPITFTGVVMRAQEERRVASERLAMIMEIVRGFFRIAFKLGKTSPHHKEMP